MIVTAVHLHFTPAHVDTYSRYVAYIRRYAIPDMADDGYCDGCLSEHEQTFLDPEMHTCGMFAPADAIVVTVRSKTGERENDKYDLCSLPF